MKINTPGVIFLYSIMVGLSSFTINAAENDKEALVLRGERQGLLVASSKKQTATDAIEKETSCRLVNCFTSCCPFGKPSSSSPVTVSVTRKPTKKCLNLPVDVIQIIGSFLNYSDQLRLYHVNKELRKGINEDFWKRQIEEQEYIIWDDSMPMARIFFANYFYHKGFGIHPKLPERVVHRRESIDFLQNSELAKKSLDLGFPKGQLNYAQIQHKMYMLSKNSEKVYLLHDAYRPLFQPDVPIDGLIF